MIVNNEVGRNAPTLEATAATNPIDRTRLVGEVARMVAEWEGSDELPTELAERLFDYFSKKLDTSDANCIA